MRRLAEWPLLLVLSWQTEQSGRLGVLRTALNEAGGQGQGEIIEPGPLGADAIATLLAADGMPPIDVARLLAETRGLPMLVHEYVEALRTAGAGAGGAGAGGGDMGDWWPTASVRDLPWADLLHADGQREPAMTHLKEAARRFASVDVGDAPRPEVWTLVEW